MKRCRHEDVKEPIFVATENERRLSFIEKITLFQFRNYREASFQLAERLVCITGANGVGKTNLLDAIYYLCYTKSYFTSYQQHCILQGENGFRVEGWLSGVDGNAEKIACKWMQGKKYITVNDVAYEQVTEHIGKYAAVMIAPDDLEIINDGSAGRRKWIDGILSQTDKEYFKTLSHYQHTLEQRNAYLKQHNRYDDSMLDYYDSLLVQYGMLIYNKRADFMKHIAQKVQEYYVSLSGGRENLTLVYESDLMHKDSMDISAMFSMARPRDQKLQRTTKGVHRDDFLILLDDLWLKQFGSQGQKKTALLALKLAQYKYLSEIFQHAPILLLDDIFEKIDHARLQSLVQIIKEKPFNQIIVTDTQPVRLQEMFMAIADPIVINI